MLPLNQNPTLFNRKTRSSNDIDKKVMTHNIGGTSHSLIELDENLFTLAAPMNNEEPSTGTNTHQSSSTISSYNSSNKFIYYGKKIK